MVLNAGQQVGKFKRAQREASWSALALAGSARRKLDRRQW